MQRGLHLLRLHCGLGTVLCFTNHLLSLKPAFEADVLKTILLLKKLVQRVRYLAPNHRGSDQEGIWRRLAYLQSWRASQHDIQLHLPKPLVLPLLSAMLIVA